MDFKKVKLEDKTSEYDDWKGKSHLERLNMLEKLRRQFVITVDPSKRNEIRKIRIK